MPDIIACGEMLIDFISTVQEVGIEDAPAFEKAAGGAPANVAVGLARQGVASGFIGKVGEDSFGRFLVRTLASEGVDTSGVHFTSEARTGLAFVSLREDGERDFVFYRHPSADMLFDPDDVDAGYLSSAKVLHYGSILFGAERSRAGTLRAVDVARANALFLSYDPNLRLALWPSKEAALEGIMLGWEHANLIKISLEEAEFLGEMGGYADVQDTVSKLWHERLRLLVVTCGAGGTLYFSPQGQGQLDGFRVDAVDTTGAGDGFLAGLLAELQPVLGSFAEGSLGLAQLERAVRYANASGALTTTKRGAIPALPMRREVEAFLTAQG